jgi:hypothetical protein
MRRAVARARMRSQHNSLPSHLLREGLLHHRPGRNLLTMLTMTMMRKKRRKRRLLHPPNLHQRRQETVHLQRSQLASRALDH